MPYERIYLMAEKINTNKTFILIRANYLTCTWFCGI